MEDQKVEFDAKNEMRQITLKTNFLGILLFQVTPYGCHFSNLESEIIFEWHPMKRSDTLLEKVTPYEKKVTP